eukprot:TRINITY_DN14351_c0_g1_i1.p1 TRINITY_DN14351_c0_g1~~TRINITY_DN14351_c0_g1_i1.p1  ORF type:complete len:148 (-),score=40.51 TRINITY_DN14351_c0_g1_i1:111-554(-)
MGNCVDGMDRAAAIRDEAVIEARLRMFETELLEQSCFDDSHLTKRRLQLNAELATLQITAGRAQAAVVACELADFDQKERQKQAICDVVYTQAARSLDTERTLSKANETFDHLSALSLEVALRQEAANRVADGQRVLHQVQQPKPDP